MRSWRFLILGASLLFATQAKAYPEFIGYGYSTCITCHFNGAGGGPLNDYGRALWSAEISSRALYPSSMSDEDIAAQSGFLGPVELPYWIRPHVKYRGLELKNNPGSVEQSSKFYDMQEDLGLTVANQSQRLLATATWGHVVDPNEYGEAKSGFNRFLAEEYYVRVEPFKTWWMYAGMMEKIFGLRNIDHSSYQRTYQGFNVQNNTPDGAAYSQGVVLQKIATTWELSANYFFGNPYDEAQYKQHGVSLMGEFEVAENKRLGASVITEKSDLLLKQIAAIHYRHGLSKGSALLVEWGLLQNKDPNAGTTQTGSYNLIQALVLLTRGYNLTTTIERYNQEFKASSPDQWKWAFGFLVFPAPRFELRAEAVNERQFSTGGALQDMWSLEGQIHVSL